MKKKKLTFGSSLYALAIVLTLLSTIWGGGQGLTRGLTNPLNPINVTPFTYFVHQDSIDTKEHTERPSNYDSLDKSCQKVIRKTSMRVKVVLRSDGKVGEITRVPHKADSCIEQAGLYDVAMNAAKQMKFTPKIVNGEPVSVIATLEYRIKIK